MPRVLDEVLQSTSDVLFPAELGERLVTIHSSDVEGDTPLHVMAWRNDLEAVHILVGAGANVNAVGDMGETPLHVAVSMDNPAMVHCLLSAGAQSDIRSEFGETPREKALKRGGKVAMPFKASNDS